jgi:ferredoxin-NADP reductase
VTYVPTASRASIGADDRGVTTGRASAVLPEIWHRLGLTPHDMVAYLCGHPSVVAAIGEQLEERGMDPSAIRREEYWPVPETTRAND